MIYRKIKDLLNKKGLTIEKMSNEADITPAGFHYMVQNDTLKVKTLQKISDYLGVPITYWFEENKDKISMVKDKKVGYGEDVVSREDYEFLKEQIRYLQNLGKEECDKKSGTYE
jgi:transcriptional regulator with XRE-family HTH domain